MYLLAIISVFVLSVCWGSYIQEPIAETKYGYVKGKLQFSRNGREFYAYKGIPYAKPPINERRFKSPEEPNKWDKVFDAQTDAPHCIQKNYLFKNSTVEGSEDCLYLNVYTPKLKVKRGDDSVNVDDVLLPVMVFIHWGGFFAGYSSSDYLGPEYLMDKDVVLVTFNYRLGVLGFLCTNDDVAPGNYGLKDQLAVLKWVNQNIQHFGGNKGSVTLFGQSAGGASVNFHMYNKESRQLFHRAISESGSSLALWAKPTGKQVIAATIQGTLVNYHSPHNSTDLVEYLRKVDAVELVESADKFKVFSVDPLTMYFPSIEKATDKNPNPFLTKSPQEYIREKDFGNIPWIIGVVSAEGLIRAEPFIRQSALRERLNTNFETLMPSLLALFLSTSADKTDQLWDNIKEFYFTEGAGVDIQNPKSIDALVQLYTDRSFVYSSYQATMFHHLKGHKDIWFYNFDYRGEQSYGDVFAATDENISNYVWGVSHCDELLYLFKTPALFKNSMQKHNDLLMIDAMVELWTNFAIYGNPTPKGKQKLVGEWKKIDDPSISTDVKKIHYLNFEGSHKDPFPEIITMKYGFYKSRIQFWENLALTENIAELNQTCEID